jgi:hypothetical protein
MKFLDRDNSRPIELNIILGCTYWENSSGEIYAVDRVRGYAWPVQPAMALKHVLLRENMKNDLCPQCQESKLETNPREFKLANWLGQDPLKNFPK